MTMAAAPPLRGSVRGIPLLLHPPGDYVSDEIRRTGDFYEAEILDALAELVEGGTIVDAGAMIGNHTAYLAAFLPHTAIHAFEPWPANLELLRRNVARFPTVTVHPVALSTRHCSLMMRAEANRGHARVAHVERTPESESEWAHVEAVPLDALELMDVTLLKLDVEEHEPQVLAGAAETIARNHPLILIEDWTGGRYAELLPGYKRIAAWERTRQTFLYEWGG